MMTGDPVDFAINLRYLSKGCLLFHFSVLELTSWKLLISDKNVEVSVSL